MSKTRENSLVKNFKGKFGEQFVYKTVDGITVLAKLPKRSNNPPTEAQEEVRERFSMAADWAKNVLKNPDTLAAYAAKAEGTRTPYILALTNYLKPPKIKEFDPTGYHGHVGDQIKAKAWDSFEIRSVTVRITDASGTVLEKGACIHDTETREWIYTATTEVSDLTGVVVSAEAKNRPNHTATVHVTL